MTGDLIFPEHKLMYIYHGQLAPANTQVMSNQFKSKRINNFTLILFAFIFTTTGYSQQHISTDQMLSRADSLYTAKDYQPAAYYYLQIADQYDFSLQKSAPLYNAACCLSLLNKKDSAILVLKNSIHSGFSDSANIIKDPDLVKLHSDTRWTSIVKTVHPKPKVLNADPNKAKFHTEDVHRFWIAYDKAMKDTAYIQATTLFGHRFVGIDDIYLNDHANIVWRIKFK